MEIQPNDQDKYSNNNGVYSYPIEVTDIKETIVEGVYKLQKKAEEEGTYLVPRDIEFLSESFEKGRLYVKGHIKNNILEIDTSFYIEEVGNDTLEIGGLVSNRSIKLFKSVKECIECIDKKILIIIINPKMIKILEKGLGFSEIPSEEIQKLTPTKINGFLPDVAKKIRGFILEKQSKSSSK